MKLTHVEKRLIDQVVDGTLVDLAPEATAEDISENAMRSWSKLHQIRAEVVSDILRGRYLPNDGLDPRALRLRGAWIVGRIDLDGISTTIRLQLSSCYIPEGLDGRECVIPRLRLDRSVITALSGHSPQGAVRLSGAHITGQLSMSGATLTNEAGPALVADGVTVDGGMFLRGTFNAHGHGEFGAVRLPGAHVAGLDMSGATLTNATGPALVANGATVNGGAFLGGGFNASGHGEEGAVRLQQAHITGTLHMSGATLTNTSGPALHADGVTVDGGAFLTGTFEASGYGQEGAVRLLRAHISEQLVMSGATLTNESGPALAADGMTVDGSAFLNRTFMASGQGERGAVRLLGAQITGQFDMSDATLTNGAGPALGTDGATFEGGAFFNGTFTARGHGEYGAVRLTGSQITGRLDLSGATMANEAGPALLADSVSVEGDAYLDGTFAGRENGEESAVILAGAHINGHLVVDAASVDRACNGATWVVDGLTYDGHPTVGFASWLVLLQSGTPTYRPQPYRQLAAAARAEGHDNDARRVLIAQRDDQVGRGDLPSSAKAWARFTKLTLGYGYQPWRALLGVAVVLIVAVIITFYTPGALAHTGGATKCTQAETFQVAVDMSIPLVSTSKRNESPCTITTTPGGQFVAWASVFLTFSGWALTALFAAGFTRAIRQP